MLRLLTAIFVLALACLTSIAAATLVSTPLTVGEEVHASIAPEDSTLYSLELGKNYLVYGIAVQHSADVIISVTGPDGKTVGVFDATGEGADSFRFETKASGTYLLAITPFELANGDYSILVQIAEPIATDAPGLVKQLMIPYSGENVPGAIVAVTETGKLTYSSAHGMANLSHSIPFTTKTVTNIGSTSKQFTAFAISMLAARGDISLDDDIRTHLPELPDFGEVVTIQNLLTHTSGYREFLNSLAMGGRLLFEGEYIDHDETIEVIKRQTELQNTPGMEWNYNNTGYALLAHLVERKTETPFAEWMQNNIFEPLGMVDTTVRTHHMDIIANSAQGYISDAAGGYREAVDLSGSTGAGGIYTTIADLTLWLRNFHTGELGGTELIKQMMTSLVATDDEGIGYGLGLCVGQQGGLVKIFHGGADSAHRSMLMYFPEIDAGLIVLSNNGNFPTSLSNRIARAFFAEHMTTESNKESEPEPPAAEDVFDPASFDSEILDDLVGSFRIERFDIVMAFTREGDTFHGQIAGQPRVTLAPIGELEFKIVEVEAGISFHRDDDGAVNSLTLHQGGDHTASRVLEEPWKPSEEDLAAYVGRYFSVELEAFYNIGVEEKKLVLSHRRRQDRKLVPAKADLFKGGFPMAEVQFVRDGDGVVTGFHGSNGQTRGVLFEKVE